MKRNVSVVRLIVGTRSIVKEKPGSVASGTVCMFLLYTVKGRNDGSNGQDNRGIDIILSNQIL